MTITNPGTAFSDWLEDNPDLDEATKLEALHECIIRTALAWIASGEITKPWANKKLWSLGVKHRFVTDNDYKLSTTVIADITMDVSAPDRATALERLKERIATARSLAYDKATVPYAVHFTDGPEDRDPDEVNPDAPTTVAGTLEKLREIIMLGNVAGPHWDCDSGSNQVLASYGLAPLPARKEFQVARPVTAQAYTTVEAYDEASARRVAEWRWDDRRRGYMVKDINGDDAVVPEVREV